MPTQVPNPLSLTVTQRITLDHEISSLKIRAELRMDFPRVTISG
jgi:hypothetical protein